MNRALTKGSAFPLLTEESSCSLVSVTEESFPRHEQTL